MSSIQTVEFSAVARFEAQNSRTGEIFSTYSALVPATNKWHSVSEGIADRIVAALSQNCNALVDVEPVVSGEYTNYRLARKAVTVTGDMLEAARLAGKTAANLRLSVRK